MKTVAELLRAKPAGRVVKVRPDQSVLEAIKVLAAEDVGAAIVMRGDRLAGILSERDYTRKVILRGRASRATRVDEIMTRDVISVHADTSLGECLQLVTDRGIRHLPVTDGDKVIGLVSIGDLVRAVVAQQAETITSLKSYIGSDYPT